MPDLESILVVAFALLPGYLAAQAFVRNAPYAQPSDLKFVLQLAVWAALTHLIAAPVTVPLVAVVRRDPELLRVGADFWLVAVVTAVGLLLVLPTVLGLVLGGITRTRTAQRALARIGMSMSDHAPTAWDAAFIPGRDGSYIRVSLRDYKDPVAGLLGQKSVAGISPHAHDLFLEELWLASSAGWTRVAGSAGVWLSADRIDAVEFFRERDAKEEKHARTDAAAAAASTASRPTAEGRETGHHAGGASAATAAAAREEVGDQRGMI